MKFTGRLHGVRGAKPAKKRSNPRKRSASTPTAKQRKFISEKIPVLMAEGFPQQQAIAIAYRMAGVPKRPNPSDTLVARWQTRGGKYWMELYERGDGTFYMVHEAGAANFGDWTRDQVLTDLATRIEMARHIDGINLQLTQGQPFRSNPGPGLAILNPLPAHLEQFARDQQLNPAEREEFNKAIAKYVEFHGVSPDEITIEEVADDVVPEPLRDGESRHFLVGMGATEDVSYSANQKAEYLGSNKRGIPFRHETTSKPHMATDADGSAVFIINRDDARKRMSISDWMYD